MTMTLVELPWLDVLTWMSAAMAVVSSVRFLFPAIANGPWQWQSIGLHEFWKPFPPEETVRKMRTTQQICQNVLEDFFQSAGIGTVFFGEDLRLKGMNSHARVLLGNPAGFETGRFLTEVVPDSLVSVVLDCWQDKVNARTFDDVVLTSGQVERRVAGYAVLLHDGIGEYYGAALFLLQRSPIQFSGRRPGVTPVQQGMEIDRYKHLASIGIQAAAMAHEIKNPLVAMKTFAELLPVKYDDAEFRNEFSKIALNQVRRIESILNDLLDYARPKRPVLVQANPMDILQEAMDILSAQMGEHQVRVKQAGQVLPPAAQADSGARPPVFFVDIEQMRRVFLNVLLNAMEAMPKGGELCIESVLVPGDLRPHDLLYGKLEICVADTGPGIAPRDLERIFEPFYTTKKKGSGLGLAIAKRIMEDHGGSIEFKSGKEGTRCCLSLPIWRENEENMLKERMETGRLWVEESGRVPARKERKQTAKTDGRQGTLARTVPGGPAPAPGARSARAGG